MFQSAKMRFPLEFTAFIRFSTALSEANEESAKRASTIEHFCRFKNFKLGNSFGTVNHYYLWHSIFMDFLDSFKPRN